MAKRTDVKHPQSVEMKDFREVQSEGFEKPKCQERCSSVSISTNNYNCFLSSLMWLVSIQSFSGLYAVLREFDHSILFFGIAPSRLK